MIKASILENLEYRDDRVAITVLFESATTKEIRIAFRKGQKMNKHQTPFPITVEMFEGKLDFGVNDKVYTLAKGDIVSLEGSVPHDLMAIEDSIVRLSLSKSDSVTRVEKVVEG